MVLYFTEVLSFFFFFFCNFFSSHCVLSFYMVHHLKMTPPTVALCLRSFVVLLVTTAPFTYFLSVYFLFSLSLVALSGHCLP